MDNHQYNSFLKKVSKRIFNSKNYTNFKQFENDWLNYYHNIYIPNSIKGKPPRIFIAESAPCGTYINNLNYIFHQNTLNNYVSYSTDMYLYRYYRGIFPKSTPKETKQLSKQQALINLSKENILILDLLPTHGIKLETKDRIVIKNKLVEFIDFNFLNDLNFYNQSIHYVFSVPPSLYTKNFCTPHLKNNNFIEFGNVNTGQGHSPSIQEIRKVIKNGF